MNIKKDKKEITNPHDKFFRETWTNVSLVRSFLQEYLPPEIRSLIALDSLSICKDSFIEANMKEFYSDMLYKAQLGSQPGLIYFLFEHKSHPDKLIFLQLLRYMLSIWELHCKQTKKPDRAIALPVIIPLVVYHGKKQWHIPRRFADCFQEKTDALTACIPDFTYQLHDLSRYSDEEIKGEVMMQVALRILKHSTDDDLLEKLPAIFGLLTELAEQETGLQYFATLFKYILNLKSLRSVSLEQMQTVLASTVSTKQGELIMTIAEQLRQEGELAGIKIGRKEGWQKGKQEGWQKGKQEGKQEGTYQTAANFKALGISYDIIQQATGLSIAEIERLQSSKDFAS